MSLKISKPQDAPIADNYNESVRPPKVAELCDRLGLAYPNTRRAAYEPNLAVDFSISRKHCFHDYHMRDIEDPLSPFQDWALDMHVARHEKEALWLTVITLGLKKIKPIVQSRGAKRMKHAFAEALKRKGWDRYGNPLSEKDAKKAGIPPASKGLYGTVRVRIFELKKFCAAPYVQVLEFWERQLDRKIRRELEVGGTSEGRGDIAVRRFASGGGRRPDWEQTGGSGREQKEVPHGQRTEGSKRDSDTRVRPPRPAKPKDTARPTKISFI